MIANPVEEIFKKTTAVLPFPTGKPTDVAPIPSVVPTPVEHEFAGESGKQTLWVVFFIMLIASAAFSVLSWRIPVSKRLYHVVTTLITTIAAISYFAMATGQGTGVNKIVLRHQHDHVPDTFTEVHRQVFWARYVDWALTTPLLLLDLGILAGLSGAHLTIAIVADIIMILTGLFAAFGSDGTPQKWGWYTIACVAYLVVIWHLAVNGRATANAKSAKVGSFFLAIAGFTIIVWTAYPIVWAIGDGSRKISVSSEIIAYAVLDVLAKPIFGAWLLFTHAKLPDTNVELGGFWTNGLDREGTLRLRDDDGA